MSLHEYEGLTLRDLMDEQVSSMYLADLLRRGELSLLLGAGVSMSSGLPSWQALVEGCEAEVGLPSSAGRSTQQLMEAIDVVRRKLANEGRIHDLHAVVRRSLYPPDFLKMETYPDAIVEQRMLIALGALVMASARGSIADVFTLNFDDLLEWYLHLHGFSTQVVSTFPSLLRGDRDVAIFHPHGFLPLVDEIYSKSDWLVLSHSELVNRLTGEDSKWPTLLESRFLSKKVLAVGTSMNDVDLQVIFKKARRVIDDQALGFVLVSEMPPDRLEALLEAGLVPICVGSREAIPEYLLKICRNAALEL